MEPGSVEVSSCSIGRQGGSCLPQVPVSWDSGSSMALVVFRPQACLVPSCAAAPSPLYWPGLPVSSRLKSSSYSEFTIKIGACQHVGISFGFKFRCYLEMAHTWFDVLIIIWEINSLIEKILCLDQKLLKGPCYSPTNENRNHQDFWLYPMRFMSLNFNCFKRGNNLEMKRKYLRGKNMLTFSLTRGKCLDRGGGRYLCRGRREQKSKRREIFCL